MNHNAMIATMLVPALLLITTAAPAAPGAAPQELLGIPLPGGGAVPGSLPPPPYWPGDDALVPVPGNQNEFSISANPLDPDHLVAGANDYSPGDARARFYASTDGGATWQHGLIPVPEMPETYTVSADPSVAFGPGGEVYYAGIAFNRGATNGGANGIFMARSDDGGLTWSTSVPFAAPSYHPFHDKPYIAVDPASGAIYLTYTLFPHSWENYVQFSKSLDGGRTWSTPVVLGPGQFSLPVAGPAGEVYVAWITSIHGGMVEFARSADGGTTWSVTEPLKLDRSDLLVPFRHFAYPVMDVARGGPHAGRIYLGGSHATPFSSPLTSPDLRIVHSDDGGLTWSEPEVLARPGAQLMPWMAVAPDGTVGLTFLDSGLSPTTWATWGPVVPTLEPAADATLLVQVLATRAPGLPVWATSVVSDVPSLAGASLFWGDYQGLAATSDAFHVAWGDARLAEPCECLFEAKLDFATAKVAPLSGP